MAIIRDIRKRIKSIENTKKVTHAMELVAAAKMRKTQTAAISARPYAYTLANILAHISSQEITHPLLASNDSPKQMIILVTSDRGLAGGLNINLFREILRLEIKNAIYITIGKKATNFASKTASEITASFGSEQFPPLDLARTVSKIARDAYTHKEVSKVSILYPHFESTIKQTPRWVRLLPITLDMESEQEDKTQPINNLLFEPDIRHILNFALPHHILTQIYQVLLEAKAAEHSARMVAMKNATDAAGDLVDDLTLTYNQARQEAITKELLDIVTAQKALE